MEEYCWVFWTLASESVWVYCSLCMMPRILWNTQMHVLWQLRWFSVLFVSWISHFVGPNCLDWSKAASVLSIKVSKRIKWVNWSRGLILFLIICLKKNSGLENPKSSAIYTKINQQIEKWTKIVHLLLYKISLVSFVSPKLIASYFLYYTTDLGSEAFQTPFLMW